MGQAKQRKQEIEALKNGSIKLFWLDESFMSFCGMELPCVLPDELQLEKNTALGVLYLGLENNTLNPEVIMVQAHNILSHYHKLQPGKCYLLETAIEGTHFGPKMSGEISEQEFNSRVEFGKKLSAELNAL